MVKPPGEAFVMVSIWNHAPMATLTLKNVPLEEAVAPPPFDPEAFLARVDAFRERLAERGVWVTEERLREAIEEGRP